MIYRLVFLVCLFFSSVVQAQDVITFPPGDDVIIQMNKGEPAPYQGALYNVDTAIRWGYWLQQYKLRLKEDVEAEKRKCKVHLEFKDKELKLEREKNELIIDDLRTRLGRAEEGRLNAEDDARNPSFFKTFEFGLIVGVIVTSATTAMLLWASGSFNK